MGKSSIEWCDETWNPIVGCSRVSEGCKNCYAEKMAFRLENMGVPQYQGITRKSGGNIKFTGKVNLVEKVLNEPYKWRKRRLLFVNSMGDLFHESIPLDYIQRVFKVILDNPNHMYLILTKRADRLIEISDKLTWTDWIGIGVSVENMAVSDRIDAILNPNIPHFTTKFLSLEPLLEDVSPALTYERMIGTGKGDSHEWNKIDWIITGGESGTGARRIDPKWVRNIRDVCATYSKPFFFKQWGGVKKKKAGNTLDGKTHMEYPFKFHDHVFQTWEKQEEEEYNGEIPF